MTRLPIFVGALALMTVDLSHLYRPTSSPRSRFDHHFVVGFGLLSHRVRADGRLIFALDTCVIGAGTSERELVDSLESDLTDAGVLAAYDLHATALPLLLSVTKPGEHPSIAALASAPPERSCDLAQRTWAKSLVPFEQACKRAGIDTVPSSAALNQALWSFGATEHMTAIVAQNAIACWRLWLAHYAETSRHWQACASASTQLDFWLEQNPLPEFDRHGRRLPTSRPAQDA